MFLFNTYVISLWDNGSSGSGAESSGLFNRSTGAVYSHCTDLVKAAVSAAEDWKDGIVIVKKLQKFLSIYMIKETNDGVIVNIQISPNAKKNEIIKTDSGIKIKITEQPIEGKANKALIEFLSKNLKIPKTYIQIIKGETSKDKTVLFKTNEREKVIKLKNLFNE